MSVLSEQLVSAFVRATNDQPEIENDIRNDPYLYGTVTNVSIDQVTGKRTTSVMFDGASVSTPMTASAVEVTVNDRVMCLIKNRQGQVVANMTAPPVGQSKFESYKSGVTAEFAAVRTEYLEADTAVITELHTKYIDTDTISAQYATLNELHTNYFTSDVISGRYATLSELHSGYIDAATIDADYAQIDLGNIAQGTISTYMLGNGVVGTAQIADGSITSAKIVSLTANLIQSGTLNAGVIDVINLSADSITVGKITYQQLEQAVSNDISGAKSDAADALDAASQAASDASAAASSASSASRDARDASDYASRSAASASSASSSASSAASSASSASDYASIAAASASSASNSASQAATTAASKAKVFYQDTQPSSTGRNVNDVWFDTTNYSNSSGVKMYYWNGSSWILRRFGSSALRNGCISHDLVDANAISAKNIVAGSITAGCLNVANIFGNSAVLAKIWSEDITATNTITSGTFIGGLIKSSDYVASTESTTPYSSAGMGIDLANKKIESPYFALNNNGAYIDGHISARTLNCGGLLTFDGTDLELSNNNSESLYRVNLKSDGLQFKWFDNTCVCIYAGEDDYPIEAGIRFYGAKYANRGARISNWIFKNNDGVINGLDIIADALYNDSSQRMRDFGELCLVGKGVNPVNSANISASLEISAKYGIRGSGAYQNVSDERYKIETLPLSRLELAFMALEPIEYIWTEDYKNRDDKHHFGLKAQQVVRCLANCGVDFNEYGVVSYYNDIYSIAYSELIPLCIHMIQKQQKEIDRLKSLEARVEQQQFMIEQLFNRLPS